MKVVKMLAGGLVVVATYNVGKLVGGVKAVKYIIDGLEEVFPGTKKAIVKKASDRAIEHIFDKPEHEESQ